MILGFISLLLTISDVPISNICIPEAMANSFLPCKNNGDFVGPDASSATQFSGTKSSNVTLSAGNNDESYCKSKVRNLVKFWLRKLNATMSNNYNARFKTSNVPALFWLFGTQEMLSLVSREGVMELKIFVSFLAVFHVIYCVLTMGLGQAKVQKFVSPLFISVSIRYHY